MRTTVRSLLLVLTIAFTLAAQTKVSIEMINVKGGKFKMGGGLYPEELPEHQVTLQDFQISKYEVTKATWKAVMGDDPYGISADDLPVTNVTWYDAIRFCNKLSERNGLKKIYTIDSTIIDTNNRSPVDNKGWTVTMDPKADGYRLPTEAEWEFAARGGSLSKNFKYSGSDKIEEVAWFINNSENKPHPVGKKKANELGIHDMTGNVWEWCWDWYGNYPEKPVYGGPLSGEARVQRGGSCNNTPGFMRSLARFNGSPAHQQADLGFRVARSK